MVRWISYDEISKKRMFVRSANNLKENPSSVFWDISFSHLWNKKNETQCNCTWTVSSLLGESLCFRKIFTESLLITETVSQIIDSLQQVVKNHWFLSTTADSIVSWFRLQIGIFWSLWFQLSIFFGRKMSQCTYGNPPNHQNNLKAPSQCKATKWSQHSAGWFSQLISLDSKLGMKVHTPVIFTVVPLSLGG